MINDADIEMMQLNRQANRMSFVTKKHGVCFHGSLTHLTCDDCGVTFKDDNHWMETLRELEIEWM